jgi:putative ABC transport system permease protein
VTVVVAGSLAGIVLAWGATRVFAHLLHESSAGDWLFHASAATLVAVVGLAASWIPARRAAAVEPLTALRID